MSMKRRSLTFSASLAAAFALAAAGSLAGAAAPAHAFQLKSTDASANDHLNVLRFPPRSPRFRPCIGGTVRLWAGDFWHGAYAVSETHRDDPDIYQAHIRIRVPGTYKWTSCRGWNSRIEHYQVRSTLRGHRFSHTIKNTFDRDPNNFDPSPSHVYGNGNYEWGGRIIRYTPDATELSGS